MSEPSRSHLDLISISYRSHIDSYSMDTYIANYFTNDVEIPEKYF